MEVELCHCLSGLVTAQNFSAQRSTGPHTGFMETPHLSPLTVCQGPAKVFLAIILVNAVGVQILLLGHTLGKPLLRPNLSCDWEVWHHP